MIGSLFHLRRDTLLAFAVFLTALTVYLRTLCPTLYWGDCGELATAAAVLGVPHPTGYPLWCLLGYAWVHLLPVGSVVWRLNTMSAVFGALAVTCLYGFARRLGLPRPVAVAVSGLLAFNFTFWQQCLITETYTLAALFTCLNLFLAARWRARGCRDADLRLLAVSYGFTLTSHQINTLFLPGFLMFLAWTDPTLLRWRDPAVRARCLRAVGCGLLPLLLYAYLPLRARAHPAYSWGDITTPAAFFYHVTGRCYSQMMFHGPWHDVLLRLQLWAHNLRMQYPWPLVALAGLGLGLLWARGGDRPLAALLSWILLADIVYVINYAIYNGYIYYIPSYVVLSALVGYTCWRGWLAMQTRLSDSKRPAFAALAAASLLAWVPLQAFGHWYVDLSRNWICDDYGYNLLASVPAGGVLVEDGDDTAGFTMLYLQTVEHYRTDVTVVRRGMVANLYDPIRGRWANGWYWDRLCGLYPPARSLFATAGISPAQALTEEPLRRLMAQAVASGRPVCVLAPADQPVYINSRNPITDEDGRLISLTDYLSRHYATAQVGLVVRLYARGRRPSDATLLAQTERVWSGYRQRGVYTDSLRLDTFLALPTINYMHGNMARARLAWSQGHYQEAAQSYRNVLALSDSPEAADGLARCAAHARTAAR